MTRGRRLGRWLIVILSGAAAVAVLAWLARAPVERRIRARLESEAARLGLRLQVGAVRLGLRPVLAVSALRAEKPGLWTVAAESVELGLGLPGPDRPTPLRVSLGHTGLAGPAGVTLRAVPTVWDVLDRATLELREPARGLTVRWSAVPGGGRRVDVQAKDVPMGALLTVGREGVPLLDAGVLDGAMHFASASGATTFDVSVQGRSVRLASFADDADAGAVGSFGEPTSVQSRFSGSWNPARQTLELPRWSLATSGAALSGSLTLADVAGDPRVELALEVERVDFARLLEMSALAAPSAVSGGGSGDGLGSASLTARVSGRLADPSSFTVRQRLQFTPPARPLPALERLRGDFVHEVPAAGGVTAIHVSAASPDFVALEDVPALFVETLLLGEDYGFFGHGGLDLAELPAAVLTNWSRGGAARGASTITQQLAKNLFLSREKRLGRKLQELSVALLLESTLGKRRILEIYLNVIEWGPGLYGLRPAARRYFGREPRELTPRQMAFLVALIPGPLKYQRSFASGTLSPGFRPLVDHLLGKLREVGALGEEEYQAALAEELFVAPAAPGPDVSTR